MSKESRRDRVAAVALCYRQAEKVERGRVLDEFVANTCYQRKYAISLLITHQKRKEASNAVMTLPCNKL